MQAGLSIRAVARQFGVSRPTVERWVARAAGKRLDRVEWADRPPLSHTVHRTPAEVADRLLDLRRELRTTRALGEYGALAIRRAGPVGTWGAPPAVRTIGRILERRGALDGQRRLRRPPPPRGWSLPAVARGRPAATASTSSRGSGSGAGRRSRCSRASPCTPASRMRGLTTG